MSATSTARRRRRSISSAGLLSVIMLAALAPASALGQAASPPQDSASPAPASSASALASPPAAAPGPRAWRRARMPEGPAGIDVFDVIAGGPGFIAVGGGVVEGSESPSAAIWTSRNGRRWRAVELPVDAAAGTIRAITATAGGFVAVGSGCCPDRAAVWLSPDGLTWERLPDQPGFEGTAMLDVTATASGLLAVGCEAVLECGLGVSWTSTDGRAWSEPVPFEDMLSLAAATTDSGILALGTTEAYGGDAVLSVSPDGVEWGFSSRVGIGGSLEGAAQVADRLIVVGGTIDLESGVTRPLLLSSEDGLLWTPLPARRLASTWLEDVVSRGDGLLLVGWRSTADGQVPTTVWTSDLEAWRRMRFPREVKSGGTLHAAAFSPDGTTAVAVGSTMLNRGQVPTIWVSAPRRRG